MAFKFLYNIFKKIDPYFHKSFWKPGFKGVCPVLTLKGCEIIPTGYRYQHKETVNKGEHNIYTGGKYDSHLLVPVIPLS